MPLEQYYIFLVFSILSYMPIWAQTLIDSNDVSTFNNAAEGSFYIDENDAIYLGLQDGSLTAVGELGVSGTENGQLAIWDGTDSKWIAEAPKNSNVSLDPENSIQIGADGGAYFSAYEKLVIWAAESGVLVQNSYQWSFGDQDFDEICLPLPEDWEAYAVSFHCDVNGANDTVEIEIMDLAVNSQLLSFTASGVSNNMNYTETLANPVQLNAGTCLAFRTGNISSTNMRRARVAVWLRRHP